MLLDEAGAAALLEADGAAPLDVDPSDEPPVAGEPDAATGEPEGDPLPDVLPWPGVDEALGIDDVMLAPTVDDWDPLFPEPLWPPPVAPLVDALDPTDGPPVPFVLPFAPLSEPSPLSACSACSC